jgi:hypothetical protein
MKHKVTNVQTKHDHTEQLKEVYTAHRFSAINYRCEDGSFPVSESCVTISNPRFASQQSNRG